MSSRFSHWFEFGPVSLPVEPDHIPLPLVLHEIHDLFRSVGTESGFLAVPLTC